LKKVFQESAAPATEAKEIPEIVKSLPKQKAAPKPKAAPAPKAESSGITEGGVPGGLFILPASVVGVAGLWVAASKLDEGWVEFMNEASCKDSNLEGAGYEVAIKEGAAALKVKTGTKKFFKK